MNLETGYLEKINQVGFLDTIYSEVNIILFFFFFHVAFSLNCIYLEDSAQMILLLLRKYFRKLKFKKYPFIFLVIISFQTQSKETNFRVLLYFLIDSALLQISSPNLDKKKIRVQFLN